VWLSDYCSREIQTSARRQHQEVCVLSLYPQRPCNNRKTIEEQELEKQLYELIDGLTIHPQFEQWALEAIKSMNSVEADERQTIERSQFSNVLQLRQQYDKLVDMASKELIQEIVFKEKSVKLLANIKEAEAAINDTSNRAESWREGLYKTIDVVAHSRQRFELGI
jgi:hypothetical protein